MKKFYVLTMAMLFMMAFTFAQQVEITGMGMYDNTAGSLDVDDSNLEKVTLCAVYLKSSGGSPGDVSYWDDNNPTPGTPVSFVPITDALNYSILPEAGLGYYPMVLTGTDVVGITSENIIVAEAHKLNTFAFYAYLERDDLSADYYSVFDYTHVHCWANGPNDVHTYELELLNNGLDRNVTITMPFTGFQNNEENMNRKAVVIIEADGMTTLEYEFQGNNVGDYFHLFTSDAFDMPDGTNKIFVSVYSPDEYWDVNGVDKRKGDSFMCGGVVADVTEEDDDDPGCTYTQGYWKTHSDYGPAGPADPTWDLLPDGPDTEFYLSGKSWFEVFWTPVKGNKYYSLAHQFMAAHLNFLNDADPTDAQTAYNAAKTLFETYTPAQVKADKKLNKKFGKYIGTLTDYNEGTIGPGHCDDMDGDDGPKSSELIKESHGLEIYPNPMGNSGTIEFVAANAGTATVEVYNMVGSRIGIIYNDVVESNEKQTVAFSTDNYSRGLYIVVVRNGSSVYKQKLSIVK